MWQNYETIQCDSTETTRQQGAINSSNMPFSSSSPQKPKSKHDKPGMVKEGPNGMNTAGKKKLGSQLKEQSKTTVK